jgi:hypothetical protein
MIKIKVECSFKQDILGNDYDLFIPKSKDKYITIKLTRINPNGQYGTYAYEKELSKEQIIEIENILGIKITDYKFN